MRSGARRRLAYDEVMTTAANSPWQFGIRHLLLAMLMVAATSGVLAPILRDLTTGQWLRLGARFSVLTVCAIVLMVLFIRWRIVIERRLGAVDWTVVCRGESWSGTAPLLLLGITALALLWIGAMDVAVGSARRINWEERFNVELFALGHSASAALFAAVGLSYLRYPLHRMAIGETGVVIWMHYFSWRQITWTSNLGNHPSPLLLNVAGWKCWLYPPPEVQPQLAEYIAARSPACMRVSRP